MAQDGEVMSKPIGARVLVRREKELEQKNGLFIPQTGKEKQQRGKVLEVGKKVEEVLVDDTVLFGKYAGTEVEIDGETLLILKDEDVLVVL